MNPIEEATEIGYSEDQILNFLAQKYPELTQKISKALSIGYKPRNILNFLSPFFSSPSPPAHIRAGSQQAGHALRRKEDIEANKRLMKNAANLALTLGGGAVAGRALQNVPKLAQLSNIVSKRGLPKSPGTSPMGLAPRMVGEAESVIPQTETALSGLQSGERSAREILKEMGLDKRISNLKTNNPPHIVGAAIKSFLTPGQKNWLKGQTNKSVEELVNEYLQSPDQEEEEKLVITPEGEVGELVDERQGIGSVRLPSGKIRRQKVNELGTEPPELAKQINEVITSLPEEEKSRILGFVSYTPEAKINIGGKEVSAPFMGVQFHNGDFYLYPDVSQDQFNHIISQAGINKTSGENEWGFWTKGEHGRGTSFIDVKKQLEKNFGKNFIKLKASEGYDFWKRFRKELKDYFQRRKRGEI